MIQLYCTNSFVQINVEFVQIGAAARRDEPLGYIFQIKNIRHCMIYLYIHKKIDNCGNPKVF